MRSSTVTLRSTRQLLSRAFLVLLRKSIPQKHNLKPAAELNVKWPIRKMIIKNFIQKLEVYSAIALIVAAIVAHINTLFCLVGKESCGMAEPLITLWGILFGSTLLVAGMSLSYSQKSYIASHLLFAFTIFFAATID
jgi:hypothetical protein